MLELPKKAYQRLSPPHWPAATDHAFRGVLRTGWWKNPEKSRHLERVIARRISVPPEWVLATSSCTAALGVAFNFLEKEFDTDASFSGVASGECSPYKIHVCPLTYPATYCWAINFGWDIEWVDCDDQGWPVSEVDVGVDLWGRPFPRQAVVLDAAHRALDPRHGEGLHEGIWRAVTYSFGPTKELPALHGGCAVMPALADEATRQAAESWITAGQGNPLGGGIRGYLDAPLARAISAQIRIHTSMQERRQKVLKDYYEWFGDDLLTKPGEASGHLAVVKLRTPGHRLAASRRLAKLSIDHSLHYPVPAETNCPNAKELSESLISLPCHTEMRKHDVRLVARAVWTAV